VRESLIDKTAFVQSCIYIIWRAVAELSLFKQDFQTPLKWSKRRKLPEVEIIRQARSVIGRKNDMTTWLCDTSHLLYCWLSSFNPGNDTDGEDEIEGPVLESQSMDIADAHGKLVGHTRFHSMLRRQLNHRLSGINSANLKPTLSKRNCHISGTAADL